MGHLPGAELISLPSDQPHMEAAIRYVSEHYAEINLLCLFGARGEYIELVRTYKTSRSVEYIPNGVYYPLYPLLGRKKSKNG